jgi:hypothetical protein
MNTLDPRRLLIIGFIDATIFFLLCFCIWGIFNISLFSPRALQFLLASSVIVGWRGAVYAQRILSGKDRFWLAATEGFFWGGGIMLVLQAGVTPFQWHSFITIGGVIAIVTGVIGALVGVSLLAMNRMILRVSSTPYAKQGGLVVLLVLLVGTGGAIYSVGDKQNEGVPSESHSDAVNEPASGTLAIYQSVIGKELPGYTIFRNEDFLQDEKQLKNFLTPDEIAKRRERKQGIIEGSFNEDIFHDFAALVINPSIRRAIPTHETHGEKNQEEFSVRLVICLGTKQIGEYQCDILSTLNGDFVSLPYWVEFELFKVPKEFSCGDVENQVSAQEDVSVQVLYPERWSGKEEAVHLGVAARRLHLNYDGVGIYAIGRNYGWTLVRQADGSYLNCANAD